MPPTPRSRASLALPREDVADARDVDADDVPARLYVPEAARDGVVVPVKPKAFELLAFLLRNPGQVFTRDQLLERVFLLSC